MSLLFISRYICACTECLSSGCEIRERFNGWLRRKRPPKNESISYAAAAATRRVVHSCCRRPHKATHMSSRIASRSLRIIIVWRQSAILAFRPLPEFVESSVTMAEFFPSDLNNNISAVEHFCRRRRRHPFMYRERLVSTDDNSLSFSRVPRESGQGCMRTLTNANGKLSLLAMNLVVTRAIYSEQPGSTILTRVAIPCFLTAPFAIRRSRGHPLKQAVYI